MAASLAAVRFDRSLSPARDALCQAIAELRHRRASPRRVSRPGRCKR